MAVTLQHRRLPRPWPHEAAQLAREGRPPLRERRARRTRPHRRSRPCCAPCHLPLLLGARDEALCTPREFTQRGLRRRAGEECSHQTGAERRADECPQPTRAQRQAGRGRTGLRSLSTRARAADFRGASMAHERAAAKGGRPLALQSTRPPPSGVGSVPLGAFLSSALAAAVLFTAPDCASRAALVVRSMAAFTMSALGAALPSAQARAGAPAPRRAAPQVAQAVTLRAYGACSPARRPLGVRAPHLRPAGSPQGRGVDTSKGERRGLAPNGRCAPWWVPRRAPTGRRVRGPRLLAASPRGPAAPNEAPARHRGGISTDTSPRSRGGPSCAVRRVARGARGRALGCASRVSSVRHEPLSRCRAACRGSCPRAAVSSRMCIMWGAWTPLARRGLGRSCEDEGRGSPSALEGHVACPARRALCRAAATAPPWVPQVPQGGGGGG